MDGIEGILVDEKYLGPSYGFVTLVINARTGEPLHIAKGRDAGALESFFNRLTKVQKSSIRFLGIDRANAYRAAALKHLPGVEVCYDAYHLVSNMNGVVDKVRSGEMSHPSEALKCRLKGKRYHLPKPKKTSKGMQGWSLRSCLLITRSPYHLYSEGSVPHGVLRRNGKRSDATAHPMAQDGCGAGVKQVWKFARGVAAKFNEVINGGRYGINSGRLESANAGIQRIRCKCCGFTVLQIVCWWKRLLRWAFSLGVPG